MCFQICASEHLTLGSSRPVRTCFPRVPVCHGQLASLSRCSGLTQPAVLSLVCVSGQRPAALLQTPCSSLATGDNHVHL